MKSRRKKKNDAAKTRPDTKKVRLKGVYEGEPFAGGVVGQVLGQSGLFGVGL